ncbi:MAG TPA: hypothetical protein VFZ40_14420 [Pyrinomonadaceae bacterium]
MESELYAIRRSIRLLKSYAIIMTVLFVSVVSVGFTQSTAKQTFDEIKVKRIEVVNSAGRVRARLAGEFLRGGDPDLAGLFFYHNYGGEAGGLIHSGKQDKDGTIDAWSLMTFDQYKNDQIVVLDYDHKGDRKRYGLTINERPDTLSAQVEEYFQLLRTAKSASETESIKREYGSRIPARDIVARRLFAGRDLEGSSLVTLSDPDGKPRLQLKVDNAGRASIVFLDSGGKVVRTIRP